MKINNKELGSFEITRYSFELVNNEPKIVIHMIKALDVDGNYIKFCKLDKVEKFLNSYPVLFKKITKL